MLVVSNLLSPNDCSGKEGFQPVGLDVTSRFTKCKAWSVLQLEKKRIRPRDVVNEEHDLLRVGGPGGFCTVSWISNPDCHGMATSRRGAGLLWIELAVAKSSETEDSRKSH